MQMDMSPNLLGRDGDSRNDVVTEMALLSLCFSKTAVIVDTITKKIEESDFADTRNGTIYGAIKELYYSGSGIDRFTVIGYLTNHNILSKAGDSEYIFRIVEQVAVTSNTDTYIAQIIEESSRRKLVGALDQARKMCLDGEYKSSECLDSALSNLTKLNTEDNTAGFEKIDRLLQNALVDISNEIKSGDEKRVNLGFPHLDRMLGGLRPGSLNILAARPGMGKSALAVNMAVNVASLDIPVAIFSLEMSKTEITNRIMSSGMNRSVSSIISSKAYDDSTRAMLNEAANKFTRLPIYIDDNAGTNPITMIAKINRLKNNPESCPGLVIVDYLQLMTMPGFGNKSKNEEVSAISRSLKVLAKDLDIPIIALSQMSRRAAKDDNDHTPQLTDLRDSGAIEQDADTVLFIDRPDYYKKAGSESSGEDSSGEEKKLNRDNSLVFPAYIYLSKNRHGGTGRTEVCWLPTRTLFREESSSEPDEPVQYSKRVQTKDAASSDYRFDDVSGQEASFDRPGEEPAEQPGDPEDDSWFDNANQNFPEGFDN